MILENLTTVVEEYIDARDVCPKQQERLRLHVRDFESWQSSRSHVPPNEAPSARLSAWLASLVTRYAPATVNGHRQSIVSLLRFATPDGVALPRTDRIRRQKEPQKIKPAFTLDEIRQMIAMAPEYKPTSTWVYGRGMKETVKPRLRPDGVPWGVWWLAYVRVAYQSGQYLSDLRRIKWSDVGGDGAVSFVRHKTGKAMSFALDAKAIEAARAIGDKRLLLPWEYDMAAYFAREFRKFCRFAGVRELGPKSLRRAAITAVYIEQGEEAARLLAGHFSFATTAKHYIDWSQARRPIVTPPAL